MESKNRSQASLDDTLKLNRSSWAFRSGGLASFGTLPMISPRLAPTIPAYGTDLENRANFDREDGSTGDAQMRFKKIGAWGHAARHAIKRVE
jgi:hypothetical protein